MTCLIVAAALAASQPAVAQAWAEALASEPPTWMLDGAELRLGGYAYGSGYIAEQGDGASDDSGATGQTRADLRLQRITDSGLIYGLQGNFLLLRDELSGDYYGNDFTEKLFVYTQTGLGRVELGQQDGVAVLLGFTGPVVDRHITLEDPGSWLFRAPGSDSPFRIFSQEVTTAASSSNAAKLNYLSPRLFGAQVGLSFTPHLVKAPLPALGNPPNRSDVQGSLVEFAGSYTTYVGELAVGVSASYLHGALRNPTPDHGDLYDWALGLQFAYSLDELRLAWGGALRISNGYGFSPFAAFDDEQTRRVQLSALAEYGAFRAGGEFIDGEMNAPAGTPDFGMQAWQLSAGYRANDNLQLTAGWQWFDYERSLGVFSNGGRSIGMNAGFVSLSYDL